MKGRPNHSPQENSQAPITSPPGRWTWLLLSAMVLVLAILAAYGSSFSGQFVFDDREAIVANIKVHHLWPIGEVLFGQAGQTLAGRPVVALTVAANYALGGLEVWGYHVFNLMVHMVCALLISAIVRRALRSAGWSDGAAVMVACVSAVLWAVHPLGTSAVTYVIQRAESLMAMFYLLTLYCAIRSFGSPRWRWWSAAAVAGCVFGMGSKEAMATAPVMVLLYDVVFVAGTLRESWRRHWGLYAGLAVTWLVLVALMWSGPRSDTTGWGLRQMRPWEYGATQFGVIAHYLRLVFWPSPLVLDYGWPVSRTVGEIVPPAAMIVTLAGLTAWALFSPPRRSTVEKATAESSAGAVSGPNRRRMWGFLGAWFFVILSPTSSIVPIIDPAFEHRMYLPLAAVIAGAVTGAIVVAKRLARHLRHMPSDEKKLFISKPLRAGPSNEKPLSKYLLAAGLVLATATATTLGWQTMRRNRDYQDVAEMWRDVTTKRPQNARGHCNFGMALREAGRTEEAMAEYRQSLRWNPDYAAAHYNLANALVSAGRAGEAIPHYQAVIRVETSANKLADAYCNLGVALARTGQPDQAIGCFLEAIKRNPAHPDAHRNLDALRPAAPTSRQSSNPVPQ